ncbi:alpha-L-rhamnosidase-related protein [Streptomyces sp. NBC_01497]|uniref:alpha-L-rhamnosidase-related protein n=1 Tax=Streptomyces sp. NBC_01497 TaxID=2903885 RepID=UPI002E355984|nr:alpha-L-rhamnosidase C-terminal domain-containing protein [Streptomyces sp. NBC_01497]
MIVHGRRRPRRRLGSAGAALSLGLALLLALLAQPTASSAATPALVSARSTAPRAASDWHTYVRAPKSSDVCPVSVVSTSGAVEGARNLVCGGSGGVTLTYADGGAAPTILLDYGQETGGLPYFTVSAQSGSPTLKAAYSEGLQYMSPTGDGSPPWADGDSSRSDGYPVSGPGTITNSSTQGGERYEQITLSTPGRLTLSKVGIDYIADRTQAAGYGGHFLSSSNELNKIWYAGAYTLQTDLAPADSLPGTWSIQGGGLQADGSKINDGAGVLRRGSSWSDSTTTFRTSILHDQAGWMVRAQNAQNGYLFILDDSTDSGGAPNTLQKFDVQDGAYTSLGSVALPSPVDEGTWHTVATTVSGTSVTISLDGSRIDRFDTTALPAGAVARPAGTIGFREFGDEKAAFKDLTVVSGTGKKLYGNALSGPATLADFTPPGSNALPSVLDGARRDRAIWSGDILVEGLTDYYSVNNPEYIKQSLNLLGSRQLSSGFVPGALHPASVPHLGPLTPGDTTTYSATYSMYFVAGLASYYLHTGDKAFVAKEWPVVQRQLAWNATRLDGNGLFSTRAGVDGADWDFYDSDKGGEVAAYNILYYKALLDGAGLATAAGEASQAAAYRADAQALKARINERLYDPESGLYKISDTQSGVAQDANALAVLYGVAPSSKQAEILGKLKSALWTTPYGPLPFSSGAGDRDLVSPFVSGFELQARLAAGDTANAQELLHDVWGHMIAPGPDQTGTMWENISGSDGTPGLGAGASLSHGWSTAPTSALSGYVLGVLPDTAGYATWTVQPHPGDLAWTQGSVPTPHGDIDVHWTAKTGADRFSLTVDAPKGTSGTIAIPVSGRARTVTVNGKVVWRHGDFTAGAGVTGGHFASGYVYLKVKQHGSYRVTAR